MDINRVLYCLVCLAIASGISQTDICVNYKILNSTILRTDNTLSRVVTIPLDWYRYTGTTSGVIATSCPTQKNACGAKKQVWIEGFLPTFESGIQQISACIRIDINGVVNCCGLKNKLDIANCNGFFVYHLTPTSPDVHFCFNSTAPDLSTVSSNASQSQTTEKPPSTSNPTQPQTTEKLPTTSHPTQPQTTETSSSTSHPTQPQTTETSSTTSHHTQPQTTETSSTTGHPTQPQTTETSSITSHPTQPQTTETSSTTSHPTQPQTTETSSITSHPTRPQTTKTSFITSHPTRPQTTDTSSITSHPTRPQTTETSSTTSNPTQPQTKAKPPSTSNPTKPHATTTPENTPTTSQQPAESTTTFPKNKTSAYCGALPLLANGNITYTEGTGYGSIANLTCNTGFNLTAESLSACTINGVWNSTNQTCIPIDCGSQPVVVNGTVHARNTTFGSVATLICDVGYKVNGSNVFVCSSNGVWNNTNQTCHIVDCALLPELKNGKITYIDNTTFGSTAILECDKGYKLDGRNYSKCTGSGQWVDPYHSCDPVDCETIIPREQQHITYIGNLTTFKSRAIMVCSSGYVVYNSSERNSEVADCEADGNWTMTNFSSCVPADCPSFTLNESVHTDNWTRVHLDAHTPFEVNTSIQFNCAAGLILIGYNSIKCLPNGKWSGTPPKCKKENIIYSNCPRNKDTSGRNWTDMSPGGIQTLPCSDVYSIGMVSRRCSTKGEWMLPVDGCVRQDIETISAQVEAIALNPTKESIVESLEKLCSVTNLTQTAADGGHVAKTTSGELQKVTHILDTLVNASAHISEVTSTQYEPFLETTSNLLDWKNTDSWKSINQNNNDEENEAPGALRVLDVVDRYTHVLSNSTTNGSITANTENIVMHVRPITTNNIGWNLSAKDDVTSKSHVSLDVLIPYISRTESTSFAAVVYRNLSGILSSNMMDSRAKISSEVVSVTLNNSRKSRCLTISLTLGYIPGSSGEPHCSFWNNTRSGWDSSGCNLTSYNDTSSTCVCNHLTNFAILMSPWTENVDTLALNVISMVGCSVSMLGLIITIGLHVYLWRYVKSDRVIILMNLSLALILSYAVFIGGVDRTENKAGCTAIAILLHYIYLAVFFLMLAEGVEIGIAILYVFVTTSRLKWLLPAAWALPAVIVGISMGATQLAGYGNGQNCWLSIEGGLIWAFVAPAALIIVVNFVVLVLVINAMLRTKSLSEKSRSERSKAGVRCLCVLLPLMGCTWVIGLFYVNESMAWVQYVFAVCNSLQGLVIFIFHCVLNVKIRNALQKQKSKKPSQSNKPFVSTSFAEDSLALPRINLKQNAVRRSFSSGHDE